MSFASPWLLLALLTLPALWWLLRVTPPAPRRQDFPRVRLLLDLPSDQTPARTPLWLLLLRLAVAALLVVGLAGPILGQRTADPARGVLAIVLDDGVAAAPDWTLRIEAADRLAVEAARAGRAALLLTTAPGDDGRAPSVIGPMAATDLRAVLPTLRPHPWPPDRAAAARALTSAWAGLSQPGGSVAYIADGLAHGSGWAEFAAALHAAGPVSVLQTLHPQGSLLRAAATTQGWTVRLATVPQAADAQFGIRAEAADGRVLARGALRVAAGAAGGTALLALPTELRNRVDRLTLEDQRGAVASAADVVLLDEAGRRRPVGLLAAESAAAAAGAADAPLTGAAFFLRRALSPFAEWREGTLDTLLSQPVSVLLAADRPIVAGTEADALRGWIERGGTLIRFAGPEIAQAAQDGQPDPLLPVALLPADRQMGGSMSWGRPATLAPFPPGTPFAGLLQAGGAVGGGDLASVDVTVSRQVLADPAADLGSATWARLADGTPLVTQRPLGAGRVVLFHVTANADWSNLPLSGLFVDMLRRLLALSAGVGDSGLGEGSMGEAGATGDLAAARTLDGFGAWTSPPAGARPIAAGAWAAALAGPTHPPGLYGPEGGRRVLNVSRGLADPVAAPMIAGATTTPIGDTAPVRPLGPLLVAVAVLLLLGDLAASLRARGLLGAAAAAALLIAVVATVPPAAAEPYDAALATRLAAIRTGDEAVDGVAQAGLAGLSAYVNDRTAAELAAPVAVVPGRDDLSFYPLLYWPISAEAPPPEPAMLAALNAYMAHGGVVLIDTRDGGSGAGMASGARDVLRRLSGGAASGSAGGAAAGGGLDAPPLAPLTAAHVLARSFYLLSEFPGRYTGDTVWIARDVDRSNDSVSPLIIGAHDWAAAWAVDADGQHPFATLPGGDRQRTLAYRFGVNLVMYSLTGNYKGDQVHVPALLQRLGQ